MSKAVRPLASTTGQLGRIWVLYLLLLSLLWTAGCGRKPPVRPPSDVTITPELQGIASWYGNPFHGRRTANGEVYDMEKMTAAHRTLPFDTWVQVKNLDNDKTTTVRINDRGPFIDGRVIDLSRKAAKDIEMIGPGTARVRLTVVGGPSPRDERGRYAVQVGAFRKRENAERLGRRLGKVYGDISITRGGPSNEFYRVRVGEMKSISEAEKLARRLKSEPDVEAALVVRLN